MDPDVTPGQHSSFPGDKWITIFLFRRWPLQCFLAALVTPVLTGEHLKARVNIGTSKRTAHKPMVDIIPKKSNERDN
ncbi:hypothetical protein AV530_015693 [Patagioenas fasciata monilis]|uniref:Uncharacterized protein n=1 Tax=Patagioenas fasciata monilis TaxID=372326 RepID=A0A1V4KIF4_PATFA|nr:hypothetical protein AV530_015693 [Patagioenas fasciata monilis]